MEAAYPDQGDDEEAITGEGAHWCAAQMLDGWSGEVLLQDRLAPNGAPITLEMIDAAAMLVRDVTTTLAPYGVVPLVEQPISVSSVHPTLCHGTPDVRAAGMEGDGSRTLYVWDFKFGHKFVDEFENWQLLTYAAGYALEQARVYVGVSLNVVLRVVQPRAYHPRGPVREWRITGAQLADYTHRLAMAADEATSLVAECKPQPDACENCRARHACAALQRASYRGMALAMQAQASDLSPEALGLELRYLTDAAALMKARLSGLTTQAEMLLREGRQVPHWRMGSAQSRLAWRVTDAEAIVAGQMVGLDLSKPPEAITPTQAARAGFPEPMLATFAHRPPAGVKLELDDGSTARRIFSQPAN